VLRRGITLAAAMMLAACTELTPQPAMGPAAARLTFEHMAPILLDVAVIDYVEAWVQPGAPPDIGHLHRNSPPTIARAWVDHRLARAPGAAGPAVLGVILREGSVVSTPLPVRAGVAGLFRDEADTRIEARLSVDVELTDPQAGRIAGIAVTVTAARDIPESSSLAAREALYFELMEKLAAALDRELENGIRAEMGFLVRSF